MSSWKVKPTNTDSTLSAIQRIMAATRFAAVNHASQRRKGDAAEPYVNHLIEVAELVSNSLTEPDTDLVIAALLHDSIEDVGVTKEEIAELFGDDVAILVAEVTDDKSLPKEERKRLQVVNAPKKISNLRAILSSPPSGWTEHRKAEYFNWAKQVIDGLAAPNPMLKAEFDGLVERYQR